MILLPFRYLVLWVEGRVGGFVFTVYNFLVVSLISLDIRTSDIGSPGYRCIGPSISINLPSVRFVALRAIPTSYIMLAVAPPIFLITGGPTVVYSVGRRATVRKGRVSIPGLPFQCIFGSGCLGRCDCATCDGLVAPCWSSNGQLRATRIPSLQRWLIKN